MFLQVQRDLGGKKWFYTSRAVDDERKRRVRFSDQRRTWLVVGYKGRGEYSIPDWLSLHWDVIGMSRNLAHRYAVLN